MVKMVVYLKFTKDGHTHSGKHIFRKRTKCLCVCAIEDYKTTFTDAGWILVKEKLLSTECVDV